MQIETKLLTISQASDLLGVSKDTLRRWERIGLISPKRTSGGIRKYSFEDLKKTRFQKGRRLYRMKQLLSHHKPIVKAIFFTSLFWILIILALKIGTPQQTIVLSPILTDSPKNNLEYSNTSENYFSLKPLEQNNTVIKRN